METLHQRLAELAEVSDQRPDPGTAAAAAARGRAYRRRRRVGTASALVACVAALAAVFGVSLAVSGGEVEPAPAGSPTGIPSELYEPSPWLSGTGDTPLGVLAGVLVAQRGTWTGLEPGLVGVSATTGDYRFLDLPDAVPIELGTAALSPDGRYVAYWTTGETELSPNSLTGPVTGVAIYDSVTGDAVRQDIETDHGLSPDSLAWLDRETLLFGYGQIRGGDADSVDDQSSAAFGPTHTWRVGDDTVRATKLPLSAWVASVGHGRIVLSTDDGAFEVTSAESRARRGFRIGSDYSTYPLLDAAGRQVAYVAGNVKGRPNIGKNPNRVLVASLPASASDVRLQPRPVPGSARTFEVLAWTDAGHVALLQATDGTWDEERLVVIDVRTGASTVVSTSDDRAIFRAGQVATDLLEDPPIAAPEPPRPLDPRATWGVTGGVVLLTLIGLIRWRRRVPA